MTESCNKQEKLLIIGLTRLTPPSELIDRGALRLLKALETFGGVPYE